jgi:DNA-binding CsgD family transcriptional regulator
MKQRILTDREREEIKAFLAGKKSSTIVRMLKYRAKNFCQSLKKKLNF